MLSSSHRIWVGIGIAVFAVVGIPLTFEPIVEGPFTQPGDAAFVFGAATLGVLLTLAMNFTFGSLRRIGRFSMQSGLEAVSGPLKFLVPISLVFSIIGLSGLATVGIKTLPGENAVLPLIATSLGLGCLLGLAPAYLLLKFKYDKDDI